MLTHLIRVQGRLCINVILNCNIGPPISNEECSTARYCRNDWSRPMQEEEEVQSDKSIDEQMRSHQTQLPVGVSGTAA